MKKNRQIIDVDIEYRNDQADKGKTIQAPDRLPKRHDAIRH